jgi:pimeloyl-ACP methyl ester carboxylesterase
MVERDVTRSLAATFGRPAALVGVVTKPAPPAEPRPVTVVLLNAGVIHHIGPNRLHVLLAARLARAGFQSIRFDLSGIGDSEVRTDEHDLDATVHRDIDDALDFMTERHHASSFVLAGICTGANHGLRFAAADDRVVGVIPIDPFAYKTLGFQLRHYGRRVFRAKSWRNALTGRNQYLKKMLAGRSEAAITSGAFGAIGGTVAPPPRVERSEMRRILHTLVERRVPLLQVFTGGNIRYNHGAQFWSAFPSLRRKGAIRIEFMPDAGHTFSRHRHRERLGSLIEEWLRTTSFPANAPEA